MKNYKGFILIGFILMVLLAGCSSSSKDELSLDPKHEEFPDYILNTSEKIQETYIMAATYPKVLASVPCYCGCYAQDGHISNLDCFVDGFDSNMAVTGWDPMGIAWDICVVIAREAVEMYQDGKELKEINKYITEKYADYGEPTPTPVPK